MPETSPLEVRFSQIAADQLQEMKARAESSPDSAHATIWDAVRRLLREVLPQPKFSLATSHALRKQLGCTFRIKIGKRGRLFYLASSAKGLVIVLFLGYRKAGDSRDAYAEFERLYHRGVFDLCLEEVGQTRRKKKR